MVSHAPTPHWRLKRPPAAARPRPTPNAFHPLRPARASPPAARRPPHLRFLYGVNGNLDEDTYEGIGSGGGGKRLTRREKILENFYKRDENRVYVNAG